MLRASQNTCTIPRIDVLGQFLHSRSNAWQCADLRLGSISPDLTKGIATKFLVIQALDGYSDPPAADPQLPCAKLGQSETPNRGSLGYGNSG